MPPDSRLAALEKEFAELKNEEVTRTMHLVAAHAENRQLLVKIVEQAAEIAELKKEREEVVRLP